jgi:hypothetical protein
MSVASFSIINLSPTNIGSIKFSLTACLADSIAIGLPALTITTLTGPLVLAIFKRFSGQTIFFRHHIVHLFLLKFLKV